MAGAVRESELGAAISGDLRGDPEGCLNSPFLQGGEDGGDVGDRVGSHGDAPVLRLLAFTSKYLYLARIEHEPAEQWPDERTRPQGIVSPFEMLIPEPENHRCRRDNAWKKSSL